MVRRSIWGSERFVRLPDDPARYLYLYLLTCPHQTSSGCFVLKEAYALADLNLTGAAWTAEKYQQARAALETSGLILTDDATGEVLIDRWWKDNSPNNESWFAGARRQCEAIQSQRLRKAAQDSLEACWAEFIAAKVSTVGKVTSLRTSPEISLDERYRALGGRPGTTAA